MDAGVAGKAVRDAKRRHECRRGTHECVRHGSNEISAAGEEFKEV